MTKRSESKSAKDTDSGEWVETVDGEPEAVPSEDEAAEQTVEDLLREEIDTLTAGVEEMRLLAQRTQAELENYRKRVERERAETTKYAAVEIVREILPVLDNLERAVEAADTVSTSGDDDQLREGVHIVQKQFRDTLVRQGLQEVPAEGAPFDPHVHEAVGRVETEDHPDGTVVEVFQKGYLFKDRLLRPSMVTVAQSAEGASDNPDDGGGDK